MVELRVNVSKDAERIVAQFNAASSGAVPKAMYRAINRAVDKTVTETSREVRKIYNLRDRAVKQAIRKRYANVATLAGQVLVEGMRVPLIEFDARWTRRLPGASVKIKLSGGRKVFAGSFIARDPRTGRPTVYVRKGRERTPIKNLRSLSIPQAVGNTAVLDAIDRIAAETFEKNFEQQLNYLLGL